MAIFYVDSAATGTNAGTSWTNAWTLLGSAFTNVTTAGDVIYVSHQHNEQLSADATYTVGANHVQGNPLKIYSVNKTNDVLTAGAFVGHATSNRGIAFLGSSIGLYIYGLTLKIAGGSGDLLNLRGSALNVPNHYVFERCDFNIPNSHSSTVLRIGATGHSYPTAVIFKSCTFSYGSTTQYIELINTVVKFIDCVISNGSTHPDGLFYFSYCGGIVECVGCDLSNITNIIRAASNTLAVGTVRLSQCKLKTGWVGVDTYSWNLYSVLAYDCDDGDDQYQINESSYFGTLQTDTGIYCNDNIADTDLSWKIVSSANASMMTPFVSPWISVYHSGTSAITPYLEILRSGSSTAFTDAQVWAEWMFKGTSGSTKATIGDDRCAPLAAAVPQDSSSKTASDWTGENATSWFGKIGPSASITPAEAGDLSFRICVGAASATVYVDPQIRGLA